MGPRSCWVDPSQPQLGMNQMLKGLSTLFWFESSVFGFELYGSPEDAVNEINSIAVAAAGTSTHALVPITVDTHNNKFHFTEPTGF